MNLCIVEDNKEELYALHDLFKKQPDVQNVYTFVTAEDALESAHWVRTDVLIVDLNLPRMSGVGLIRRAGPLNPAMRILVHTVHEDLPSVLEAIKAGACGYLLKSCPATRLASSLREILGGGAPMSPSIARYVLAELQAKMKMTELQARLKPRDRSAATGAPVLTPRECEILRLLEQGHSYKEIAPRLSITLLTVHTHIKNIYAKLNAHGKIEAIRKGRMHDLI